MRRRLLFVVNADWFFLSHRLAIAQEALQQGYEVHVAADLTQPEKISALGFCAHRVKLDRSSASPFAAMKLLWQLRRIFLQVQPDVVHLVTIKPVLLGGLVARWVKIPAVVAAISGLGFVFTQTGAVAAARRVAVELLYRFALSHPNEAVIFQNRSDAELIQHCARLRPEQVEIIPGSGVSLDKYRYTELPPGPCVVLLAARLLIHKGVREFIDAARQLKGYRGARFLIVGDVDPDNPASLSRAEICAVWSEGVIEYLGYCEDMPTVLGFAHIVVLPSYREGLPKVLVEAAACGRATVTTDVPGCRDAVIENETGLLVPAMDAKALANAIRTLIDDRQLCERLGTNGRRLAESLFDVRDVAQRHLSIYRRLVFSSGK